MRVVCIKSSSTLTIGRTYDDVFNGDALYGYRVMNDNGILHTYTVLQLRPLVDVREDKIDDILNSDK